MKEIIPNDRWSVKLIGSINGKLCSKMPADIWCSYELMFFGILALKIIELDSWDYSSASSFDEVVNSNRIKKLGGKANSSHKHFVVQTYDDVRLLNPRPTL